MEGFDWVGAALGGDDRCIAHQGGDRFGVERGGHGEEDKIGAEGAADFEREGKAEIGIEAALVEFVEDHRADAGEFGVGLDHAGEDAFGDNLDARGLRNLSLAAHPVADGMPRYFAQFLGKPFGCRPRGEAARFEHEDLAAGKARLEEGDRHPSGLARAGRCLKDCHPARLEGGDQRGEGAVDGKGLGHGLLWREWGRCPRGLCPRACGAPPEYFTAKRLSLKNRIFIDQYISLRTVDELKSYLLGGGPKFSDFYILVEERDRFRVIVVVVEG